MNDGVHAAHCCKAHGCKYGEDITCPVANGQVKQKYLCEMCTPTNIDEIIKDLLRLDNDQLINFILEINNRIADFNFTNKLYNNLEKVIDSFCENEDLFG